MLTPKKFKDNFGKKVGADEESRKNQMVCSVKTWPRVMQAKVKGPMKGAVVDECESD